MIKSLKLTNFLSFGQDSPAVELGPLNVLIGPNGSGKSNFLAALDVLKNAPEHLEKPMRQGGMREWSYRYHEGDALRSVPSLEVVLELPKFDEVAGEGGFRYALCFTEIGGYLSVYEERFENEFAWRGEEKPYSYCRRFGNNAELRESPRLKPQLGMRSIEIPSSISVLARGKDSDLYPELAALSEWFSDFFLFRDWTFGSLAPCRLSQRTDLPNDRLLPDASNLALLLNRLRQYPEAKRRVQEELRLFYENFVDFDIRTSYSTTQLFFEEKGDLIVPATRLSDGTLRYLSMLAVLCDPNPSPIVCIEEPELGLHPDILPNFVKILQEASKRCQIIVTTHSVNLVDAMTEFPESILVCEKDEKVGSVIRRPKNLASWAEEYRLGELWTSGDIGGNRW